MLRTCAAAVLAMLWIAIGFIPGAAQAQAGVVGTRVPTCVLRAAPGMTASALLQSSDRFDCVTQQRAFGAGDYWVITRPLDIHQGFYRLTVRTASVWQQRMTLYALYADGKLATIETDSHDATIHLQLGGFIQRSLPRRAPPLTRLLWHVEGSANTRGIVLAPSVAAANEASSSNMVMAAIYAAFGGICAALLLYNLGLIRALRHTFLPLYCLMMVGMLLYAFSSSGALAFVFPGIDNNYRLLLNYLLLAATGIAAVLFLRHVFEQDVVPRWLDRAIHIACAALAVTTAALIAFAPWQLRTFDQLYGACFGVLLATAIPMIIFAWAKRSQYLWMFVIAWTAPIALAATRIAHNFDLIGYSFWLDNSTILSMATEALLSSLAIAYRILLITRDRDEARAQEIAQRMLADADPLTGLMNRRSFMREAIGRSADQQLLLLDIDNFKRVNDTLGHDGGDEVLRLVARVLRSEARETSLLARIGGEEFAIVTPLADTLDPDAFLAALRVERMPFDLNVTASIGICNGTLARESDWKSMYLAADCALFEAKRAGRDRTRCASVQMFAAA